MRPRRRRDLDQTPQPTRSRPTICGWFTEQAFESRWLREPDDAQTAVGIHHFQGQPQPLQPDTRMFTMQ